MWRHVSPELLRCVGKWVHFQLADRAICDASVAWFVQRVHCGLIPPTLSANGSQDGVHSATNLATASGAATASAGAESDHDPGQGDGPGPRLDNGQVVEPSAAQGVEPSAAQGVEHSAAQGVEPSAAQGVEPSAGQGVELGAAQGKTEGKRKKTRTSRRRADTKRGRREARQNRQQRLRNTFLIVMNGQGRRMAQLVVSTLQWKLADRPTPCHFADADMLAGTVEPVDPIWDRAMYACAECGRPSWYEDLCDEHAAQIQGCQVRRSAVAGLGVFAVRDIDPPPAHVQEDVLLFPYAGMYHLEQDMDRYLQRPGAPPAIRDYLLAVPGTGVVIDGHTCRSPGSMLNSTTAEEANCAFVHMADAFREGAAVFVACTRPIRAGDELLVCYNNPEWASMLGQGEAPTGPVP
jgi:hypothetical protein